MVKPPVMGISIGHKTTIFAVNADEFRVQNTEGGCKVLLEDIPSVGENSKSLIRKIMAQIKYSYKTQ